MRSSTFDGLFRLADLDVRSSPPSTYAFTRSGAHICYASIGSEYPIGIMISLLEWWLLWVPVGEGRHVMSRFYCYRVVDLRHISDSLWTLTCECRM